MTYSEYWQHCMQFAKVLVKLDVASFKIVNIVGFNSVRLYTTVWLRYAYKNAYIYTDTHATQATTYTHILMHTHTSFFPSNSVSGLLQTAVRSWPAASPQASTARITPRPAGTSRSTARQRWWCWRATSSYRSTQPWRTRCRNCRWAAVRPGNVASLIYTSGTTGPPKAVMISHDNITWTSRVLCTSIHVSLDHTDRMVSFLPLSHIAAQLMDVHCVMCLGATVYFAQKDALQRSLAITLQEVRPSFFFAVPRVYEKIHEKMTYMLSKRSWVMQMLFALACRLGLAKSLNMQYGGSGLVPWLFWLADWLILRSVRVALGLDRSKACFTAAAPIGLDTLRFFASLDIPVYEVFGQSESTGPHAVSNPAAWRMGYCGQAMPGTETKIDEKTGEICYRGRHIFVGYLFNEEATRGTFDSDGWFR
ncbi:hypothetical protein EON64_18910 [archaeon]|nr:MAG: hypothetical protein EON64_18910 [archaeon]